MSPIEIFRAGKQADVPLLAGYNSRGDFSFAGYLLPHGTAAEFDAAAERIFGTDRMQAFQALYPAETDAAATIAAQELQGDMARR